MDESPIILIVDDDSGLRDFLTGILSPCGYHLSYATNGLDSILRAARSKPNLIVMNARVAAPNGSSLCHSLQTSSFLGQVPILLIAGEGEGDPRAVARHLRADGLVKLPVEAEELRDRVATLLLGGRVRHRHDEGDPLFLPDETVGRHRRQLESLTRRLFQAQEEERRAVARELHDEVGQILTVLKINLILTQREIRDPVDPRRMSESIDLVDRLIGQVRDLWKNLRPSLLEELGLTAALQALVESAAKRSGMNVRLVTDPRIGRLDHEREITCYRVVQESLTNVIRHSRARNVRVELARREDHLELTITDDGVGFDVTEVYVDSTGRSHMGLLGMRERLSLVGGAFSILSRPGAGSEVRVIVPLQIPAERRRGRRPKSQSTTRVARD